MFYFVGMAESTTKVGSSSTINIKMQSGVNLNEVVVVIMENSLVKLFFANKQAEVFGA
jgi:hypothetical protein